MVSYSTHAAGVWTSIVFTDALVIASRRHQRIVAAVGKQQD